MGGAFNVLANTLIAGSAVAGVIIAWNGLHTWKKQLFWQEDTDLAKRALMAVYRYKDSIYSVRHPAMFNVEMQLEVDEQEISGKDERSKGVVKAYANRWAKHTQQRNELDAVILECDAIWGDEFRKLVSPLKALEHELFVYVQLHLDAYHRTDTELAKDYAEILKKRRDILYDLMDDEKDEFRKDFLNSLSPIEDFLRKKLGRNSG
ncbi:MAG: hypothetical protein ACE369_16040 [Roseovarius sp.]